MCSMKLPLDSLTLPDAARAIIEAQIAAARETLSRTDLMVEAAQHMARTISQGHRLVYVAAGSSGLMAAADAMELGGTFGIPASQIRIVMAGGIPDTADMPGDVEDDAAPLAHDLASVGPGDCLIAVSASGNTPYTVRAVEIGKAAGACVIGIAGRPDVEMFNSSDVSICLDSPPEVLEGSTRLGAATAQKVTLNTLSTLMGMILGHIYRGRMLHVRADNAKLHRRAIAIVRDIAEVDEQTAMAAIDAAGHDVKTACLLASGFPSSEAAARALRSANGQLGLAMGRMPGHDNELCLTGGRQ